MTRGRVERRLRTKITYTRSKAANCLRTANLQRQKFSKVKCLYPLNFYLNGKFNYFGHIAKTQAHFLCNFSWASFCLSPGNQNFSQNFVLIQCLHFEALQKTKSVFYWTEIKFELTHKLPANQHEFSTCHRVPISMATQPQQSIDCQLRLKCQCKKNCRFLRSVTQNNPCKL